MLSELSCVEVLAKAPPKLIFELFGTFLQRDDNTFKPAYDLLC